MTVSAVLGYSFRGSEAWLMATVAASIRVGNLVMFTVRKEPRQFTSELTNTSVKLLEANISALQMLIPVTGGAPGTDRQRRGAGLSDILSIAAQQQLGPCHARC
jgi:hypothetical protein